MRLEPGRLYDYEARAQQVLPHDYWDFIAGGSKDELTTRRNRSAFDAMSLRSRFLRDVTERQLATTVLGTPISFPVMTTHLPCIRLSANSTPKNDLPALASHMPLDQRSSCAS